MQMSVRALEQAIPEHTSVAELAKTFQTSKNMIYKKVSEYGLSLDELKDKVVRNQVELTEEEIAAAAAEIRKGWSPQERARRTVGGGPRRWSPPSYKTGELVGVSHMPWRRS